MTESKFDAGVCFRLYLRPKQFEQMARILGTVKDKPGFKLLHKAVKKAELRCPLNNRMSRQKRAQVVADEMQELLCEIETLQEEMDDWVQSQIGTSLVNTESHAAAKQTANILSTLSKTVFTAIEGLNKLEFPSRDNRKKVGNV